MRYLIWTLVALGSLAAGSLGRGLAGDADAAFVHVGTIACVNPETGLAFAPLGVAVDGDSHIYVVDGDNSVVVRIDERLTTSSVFAKCAVDPLGCGLIDVDVGALGDVYVSDRLSGLVRVFDRDGVRLQAVEAGPGVAGIGLGSAGEVLAALPHSGRLKIVDRFGRVAPIECVVADRGRAGYPLDCLAPDSNRLLATDETSRKVLNFNSVGRPAGALEGFAFRSPFGLSLARRGLVLVSDSDLAVIAVFGPDGRFVCTFGDGLLTTPTFLDCGEDGRVVVADSGKMTLEVFRLVPSAKP